LAQPLKQILVARAVYESYKAKDSWPKRNGAEIVLLAGLLALLFIGGLVTFYSYRAGAAVVATHDLDAKHTLRLADVQSAELVSGNDYLTLNPDQLEGWVLMRAIQSGDPIRKEDVSRLQVEATTDVAPETTITRDMVNLDWSQYNPDAAVEIDEVVGREAEIKFQSDALLLPEFTRESSSTEE
jgi:hypothetical protein